MFVSSSFKVIQFNVYVGKMSMCMFKENFSLFQPGVSLVALGRAHFALDTLVVEI